MEKINVVTHNIIIGFDIILSVISFFVAVAVVVVVVVFVIVFNWHFSSVD